jgi:hypothetical protein
MRLFSTRGLPKSRLWRKAVTALVLVGAVSLRNDTLSVDRKVLRSLSDGYLET